MRTDRCVASEAAGSAHQREVVRTIRLRYRADDPDHDDDELLQDLGTATEILSEQLYSAEVRHPHACWTRLHGQRGGPIQVLGKRLPPSPINVMSLYPTHFSQHLRTVI